MSRLAKFIIILAIALLGSWYFVSPYFALHQMKSAAESGDAAAISEHIDYPALRENLKASLSAKMMSEASKASTDEPLSTAVAMAMIGPMIDALVGPIIDAMITPEAVAMMIEGKRPLLAGDSNQTFSTQSNSHVSSSYDGLNTFSVTVTEHQEQISSFKLIFKRHGLFTWKLTSIEFPI